MQRHQYIGNLTRDPERMVAKSGSEFVKFDIAVNTPLKGGERRTEYISVLAFKDVLQRFVLGYLHKGSCVWVESNSLSTQIWNKRDGTPIVSVQLIANDVQSLGHGVLSQEYEQSDAAEPTGGGNGSWEPDKYQSVSDEDTPW